MRVVITVGAVCAALAGLVASALDTGALPRVPYRNCARDLWPEHDLQDLDIGAYEWQAYETFGLRNTRPPLLDVLEPQRCLAFVYDENILGEPLSLTVRVAEGRVAGRWLTATACARPECEHLPREVIQLKGYYDAMACW